MKSSTVSLLALLLLFAVTPAQGQTHSDATREGAVLLAGGFAFSSQGYEHSDDRSTIVSIVPSVLAFVSPGFGLGADVSLSYIELVGSSSQTAIAIGPKAAYFFDSGSSTIPFLGAGAGYLSSFRGSGRAYTGYRLKIGGGLMLRKDHLGCIIEADYVLDTVEDVSSNTIMLTLGFAGLLY